MKRNSIHELAEPAENLVEDAKELVAATAHVAEEKVVQARRRLASAIEKGKETLNIVQERIQEKAVAGAKATDQVIRDYPYQSIGVALGIGALIGFLLSSRRN